MCLMAPGQVTDVDAGAAWVRFEGVTRRAMTLLTPDVRPGDWVLVAAGAVVRRLSQDEARVMADAARRAAAPAAADPPAGFHATDERRGGPS